MADHVTLQALPDLGSFMLRCFRHVIYKKGGFKNKKLHLLNASNFSLSECKHSRKSWCNNIAGRECRRKILFQCHEFWISDGPVYTYIHIYMVDSVYNQFRLALNLPERKYCVKSESPCIKHKRNNRCFVSYYSIIVMEKTTITFVVIMQCSVV